MGWAGEAERAIEWGERGIRLSPFDPWITAALHGVFLGHFLRGRYRKWQQPCAERSAASLASVSHT